jgi:hypothetical protein
MANAFTMFPLAMKVWKYTGIFDNTDSPNAVPLIKYVRDRFFTGIHGHAASFPRKQPVQQNKPGIVHDQILSGRYF